MTTPKEKSLQQPQPLPLPPPPPLLPLDLEIQLPVFNPLRDQQITYSDSVHRYYINGIPADVSVTGLIKLVDVPFIPDEGLRAMSRETRLERYGSMTDDEIKSYWIQNGLQAANRGRQVHAWLDGAQKKQLCNGGGDQIDASSFPDDLHIECQLGLEVIKLLEGRSRLSTPFGVCQYLTSEYRVYSGARRCNNSNSKKQQQPPPAKKQPSAAAASASGGTSLKPKLKMRTRCISGTVDAIWVLGNKPEDLIPGRRKIFILDWKTHSHLPWTNPWKKVWTLFPKICQCKFHVDSLQLHLYAAILKRHYLQPGDSLDVQNHLYIANIHRDAYEDWLKQNRSATKTTKTSFSTSTPPRTYFTEGIKVGDKMYHAVLFKAADMSQIANKLLDMEIEDLSSSVDENGVVWEK